MHGDDGDALDPIEFHHDSVSRTSRSMLSDFGEDPVRRAERGFRARQRARGKTRAVSVDSDDYSLEHLEERGGPSSMV